MDRERRSQLLERFERATELPLLVLALAIIPLVVIPIVVEVGQGVERIFFVVDWTIWGIFASELSIRTYLAERRVNYLMRHWYDVLIVLLPFLRPLRVARSMRTVRVLRLARVGPFLIRALADGRQLMKTRRLEYVFAAGLLAIFVSAGVIYLLERDTASEINDYGTALWWAMATMTTVGYGDVVPVSAAGRGVAVFLMIVGISFFSWVTANIAAFLVEFGGERREAVTMRDLMDKLEALEREIQSLQRSEPT